MATTADQDNQHRSPFQQRDGSAAARGRVDHRACPDAAPGYDDVDFDEIAARG